MGQNGQVYQHVQGDSPFDGECDGYPAAKLFSQGVSFTYDDVILHPGFIDFSTDEVVLTGRVSKNINVKIPVASSPMDTVTEANMAGVMAMVGAIGFVHYNNTPTEQVSIQVSGSRFQLLQTNFELLF
jgi:IMP dehydrogenase